MPLAIADRRILRLVVMCVMYVAQGIPYGFVAVTLAAYLADGGATTDEVGRLVAFTLLPWTFKWLWGPLIDRFSGAAMGKRRPWILTAQLFMVLTMASLIFVPDLRADIELLGWVMFAHNCFVALQDVSVDALAVDLLPDQDRGFANGLMYGSSYLGAAIGGAGMSIVLGSFGLREALIAQVCCLLAIMLVPLLLREHEDDALLSFRRRATESRDRKRRSILRVLWNLIVAFGRRSPLVAALLALLVWVGLGALTAIGPILLTQRLGWSPEYYGQIVGGPLLVFGLVGSIGGGWVADRLGRRRTAAASTILVGVAWLAFGVLDELWLDRSFVIAVMAGQALFMGVLLASLFGVFMDLSWAQVAAAQFSAFMGLLNLSRWLGNTYAGTIERWLGTADTYVAFGVVQIAIALLLVVIDPHQNRRELDEAAATRPR